MSLEWVRKNYDVAAYAGKRVKTEGGRKGTIVEKPSGSGHVHVVLDGERTPGPYHPKSIEYLPDTEPPAPPIVAKPTEFVHHEGVDHERDPWLTESCRIVFVLKDDIATLVTAPRMGHEYWDSYSLSEGQLEFPDIDGLYQATLLVTIWPWEGDHEFQLVDVEPMKPPQPGWAKRECKRCSSQALHPWLDDRTATKESKERRYRCLDCNTTTTLPVATEPYYGRCHECEAQIHAAGGRAGRCENGHIIQDMIVIVPVYSPPQGRFQAPPPAGKAWCHCRVLLGYKPHVVPLAPEVVVAA